MKTLKMNTIKTVLSVVLISLLLPACSQESQNSTSNEKVDPMKIHEAVLYGNLDGVNYFIENGADLNVKEPMGGSTALITAITFEKTDIAKALIEAGADLSIQNNDGSTALHTAAFFCRTEIVELLLAKGADKEIKNRFGSTPRESVMGSWKDIKPVYEMMQAQLGPLGLKLDMAQLEETRPQVAKMLK